MLYDHENDISALKQQIAAASKEAMQTCSAQLEALHEDKADLKQQLRQQVFNPIGCSFTSIYVLRTAALMAD